MHCIDGFSRQWASSLFVDKLEQFVRYLPKLNRTNNCHLVCHAHSFQPEIPDNRINIRDREANFFFTSIQWFNNQFINYSMHFLLARHTKKTIEILSICKSEKKTLPTTRFNEAVFRLNWFVFNHYLSLHLIRPFEWRLKRCPHWVNKLCPHWFIRSRFSLLFSLYPFHWSI